MSKYVKWMLFPFLLLMSTGFLGGEVPHFSHSGHPSVSYDARHVVHPRRLLHHGLGRRCRAAADAAHGEVEHLGEVMAMAISYNWLISTVG